MTTLTREDVIQILEDANDRNETPRFRDADLSGLDLSSIDFTYADLTNANLSNVQADRAVFRDADLTGANLTDALVNPI